MKDLINNLAGHLGLDLTFKRQEEFDVCVTRDIGGWDYYYWFPVLPASSIESWLITANNHMNIIQELDDQ